MTSQAHLPGPIPPSCPPTAPSLLLPAFPGAALLVTSADAPGSKLIIKLKREGSTAGGTEELPRTQTFFLTGMPLGWAAPRPDGPSGPGIRTVLLTKAVEELGGRKSRVPESIPPARAPPPSDASFACTSKGVYENYRRWQRYKALARRHFPVTPDAEALACFFIPVLRSLARLRPDMTLEDGVPRAVQEWEHSSNFERMIFYEMAEKFMEFEAEEEQQIQKMKVLAGCSQFQVPAPKSAKLSPTPAAEPGQQQVYIPKKSASKSRQPRRRQRRPPSSSALGAPREIPAEAVHQYAEIMEGLETSWEEEEDEKKEQGGCRDPQDQEDGIFPDPGLLQYIDQLCDDEEFVCKVEAVIHPQFMADLLSLESSQDPLDLIEELDEELNLTPNQLIEKRLLVLSEEEREPSVCPTSQSDSTPSQSEEEDEGSGGGKGEEASCKAMKMPSPNQSIRTCQPELPGPVTASLLSPFSHQHLGERVLPPKAGRASLSSSPLILGGRESQEERALPTTKHRVDTQNLQKQNQAELQLGQAKGILRHDQRGEINPNSLSRSLKSAEDKAGRGVERPHSAECGGKDGRQGKVKGQERVFRAPEPNNHAAKAPSHEGTQPPVRQNLEPAHDACGKQNGVLQGVVKHGKRAQAIGEREEPTPKGIDHANQNMKKMLLGEHEEEGVVQLNLNGCGEQPSEKVIGQGQDMRGPKVTSSRTELDNQDTGLQSQRVGQINQHSEQLMHPECQKHDRCQRELLKDQAPFQASQKGPKSAPNAAIPHCESTVSFGKSLAGQESRTSALAGPGKQVDGHEAKVRLQKKPQLSREKTKCVPVKKKGSSGKALRFCADSLAPSTSTGQDGQQPSCAPGLETDQKVNCPVFMPSVEPCGCKGNQLTLTESAGVKVLEGQIPRLSAEHLLFSSSSGLESPSLSSQEDPSSTGKFQKTQWLLADQGKVTLWVGTPSDIRQNLNPTSNPSGCITVVEVDGGNCGPSGDHTLVSSSCSKRVPPLLPKLSLQVCSDCNENEPHQRTDLSDPLSPEDQSRAANLENEVKEPGKVERRDVPGASATLPELSDGNAEGSHGAKEEEQVEDEELSSFSSLLASKLSLSSHCYHVPYSQEQEDMVPLSPTQAGKQGSKTRHSVQVQMPQDGNVLLSKNLGIYPTVHHNHKRKSNSLGTRKSKRLRNQ